MASAAAVSCPALLIAGCASGQGKTTVTAALARYHARMGRRVKVFKTGPDFIDPTILEAASGAPVYNIDCWMIGTEDSRALLAAAAQEADLILVEGAMGLHDGEPSAADLAATFDLPGLRLSRQAGNRCCGKPQEYRRCRSPASS